MRQIQACAEADFQSVARSRFQGAAAIFAHLSIAQTPIQQTRKDVF
jgi:hypothetical protein